MDTCWFCKEAEADPSLMTNDVDLFRVIRTEGGTATAEYEKTTIKVPACRRCARLRILDFIFVGFPTYLVSFAAGLVVWGLLMNWVFSFEFVMNRGGAFWGIVGMFFVLISVGFVAALPGFLLGGFLHERASRLLLPKNYRESKPAAEFPQVKQLLDNGWELGTKPSN